MEQSFSDISLYHELPVGEGDRTFGVAENLG